MSSLRVSTAKNVSYVAASQLITVVLNFVTLTALANLLTTEDMGVVGIALIFLSLLYNFHDFGIMSAVVQRDTRVEESIHAAITLRWIISAVLIVSVLLIGPFVSGLMDISDLWIVLAVLCANMIALNLAFSAQARLTRELRLSQLAIANATQAAVLAAVAIPLAAMDYSYWSFVVGSVAATAAYVLVLNLFRKGEQVPSGDTGLAKELLSYGQHLLASGLMMFLIVYVDQVVIAGALGVAVLGVYFVAVRFGRTIGEQIAMTLNRVLFPTLSRIKDDLDLVRRSATESLRMTSIVASPAAAAMSALSPVIVDVLLGPEYVPAVFPLSVLCFQGLSGAIMTSASNAMMALGKPRYMAIQGAAQAGTLIILVYPVAIYWGINGVAVLTTALSICFTGYLLMIAARLLNSRVGDIVRPAVPSLAASAVMFVPTAVLAFLLPGNLLTLIGLLALALCVYMGALHLLSRGKDVRDTLKLVRAMLSGGSEKDQKPV